jgi:cytochrome c553
MPFSSSIKVLIALLFLFAWSYASQTPQGSADLFKQEVAPILTEHCLGCHGAQVQRSGLDLRSEESILRGGARGPAIVPGNPEKSLLLRMVKHLEEPAMPLGGDKLPDAQIAAISKWIEIAAPTRALAANDSTTPVRAQGTPITEKDRQFWSFRKPVRPVLPSVRNRSWVRNEIDRFILARLEQNQLSPSKPADPRVLIRRVYFDLIGLPPSPDDVAAFVRNPSDQAYRTIVEKLLASPQYGERWGRHWLDLSRYADSGGYEFDYDRPHAWRYRDYVIQSFNEDKPYNTFIREQLAADELFPGDATALIATGFCRNGPTVDNAVNEETRMDELDDMVTTTSSVFLGLTVGCARCHDHKYDPIPQKDYYRMQAVFFPFEKREQALVSKEEEDAFKARNKEIDQQLRPLRGKILAIEKPVRDKLISEKVEFHVRLAQSSNALEGKTLEQFREDTTKRFTKDVNLQPEEIDPLLTPEQIQMRKEVQTEIDKINATRPKALPAVMGIVDKASPGKAYLLKRGDWRNKGEEVFPGFPVILADGANIDGTNRRRQLADWITSSENPLTARVAVNRIWQYHFGKGIVRTPSDFGATGDRPSHPELLDWLATEFVARGGSWKAMHRLIVTSSTYRQASTYNAVSAAKDPENRLYWRAHSHRLEAEAIRDSILAVSGKLNPKMGGPGIYPRIDPSVIASGSRPRWPLEAKEGPDVWRRSVYIFVKRSVLMPIIEVFDCPVTTVSAPMRSVSTVSPQALALLNNEFVLEQAGYLAERVQREVGSDKRAQVKRGFQIAIGRDPSTKEMDWSLEFLAKQKDPMRDFCHALMNLNEFLYVD